LFAFLEPVSCIGGRLRAVFEAILQERSHPLSLSLRALLVRDIHQQIDGPYQPAGSVEKRCWIGHEGNACTIRTLGNGFLSPYWPALLQGQSHGALGVRHGRPVRPEQSPGDAPLIAA